MKLKRAGTNKSWITLAIAICLIIAGFTLSNKQSIIGSAVYGNPAIGQVLFKLAPFVLLAVFAALVFIGFNIYKARRR